MNILTDVNIYIGTVKVLQAEGHTVQRQQAFDACASDDVVLANAHRLGALLITQDSDFGQLVVAEGYPCSGVLYLRLHEFTEAEKAQRVLDIVREHGENLHTLFTVVMPNNLRTILLQ